MIVFYISCDDVVFSVMRAMVLPQISFGTGWCHGAFCGTGWCHFAFYRHYDWNLTDEGRWERLGAFLVRSSSDLTIGGGATVCFLSFRDFCSVQVSWRK